MQSLLSINPKLETEKIVDFLKKTFREQKIDKVVLGLSGGIDSTVALYLLKQVLPPENIFAVQMDYHSRKRVEIDLKGINVVNIPIKKIVDGFEKILLKAKIPIFEKIARGPVGCGGRKNTVSSFQIKAGLGNIMARVRMIILFDLAKQLGALVCGTENKSEKLLGYFTRFGDAASDIEPISHLYKTQIYRLAKYLKIPKEIIEQPPTAGLWDGQTDEKDFGFTYEEADQVLYYLVQSNPEILDPRFHGDDIKYLETLIGELKTQFPNAEKIIKRVQQNIFKQLTPYFLV